MLNLHPSRDIVYAVTKPIPDPLHPTHMLAEPGDELVVRATNLDFPLTVIRQLPLHMSAFIPDDSVVLLAAYESGADDPVSEQPVGQPVERRLRLLRPGG